jgi:hypothetical protein
MRRVAAYHEAGHAAMRFELGGDVRRIYVFRRAKYPGITQPGRVTLCDYAEMQTYLAGDVAGEQAPTQQGQCRLAVRTEYVREDGTEEPPKPSDDEQAWDLAFKIAGGDQCKAERIKSSGKEQVRATLSQPDIRAGIVALAGVLEPGRGLCGAEALRIYQSGKRAGA